jgi:hypothetical protein
MMLHLSPNRAPLRRLIELPKATYDKTLMQPPIFTSPVMLIVDDARNTLRKLSIEPKFAKLSTLNVEPSWAWLKKLIEDPIRA